MEITAICFIKYQIHLITESTHGFTTSIIKFVVVLCLIKH